METKERPIVRRFADGLSGLWHGWRSERSLRTQLSLSIVAFGLVLLLGPPILWQVALGSMLAVGLAAELLNASIEALLDRLHPDHDAEIGAAKDMSSAAVLVINIASTAMFAGSVVAWIGWL